MIDVLIGLLILILTVGGVIAATFTTGRSSSRGNTHSRMNSAITAFGEALKSLPYIECASTADYDTAFNEAEEDLRDPESSLLFSSNISLTILNVETGPECPGDDSGAQTITMKVDLHAQSLTRQIVKRNPDPNATPFDVDIIDPNIKDPDTNEDAWISGPSASTAIWNPNADTLGFEVFSFEWWCGDPAGEDPGDSQPTWPSADPDYPNALETTIDQATAVMTQLQDEPADPDDPDAPQARYIWCTFDAPPDGTVRLGRVFLRAVESGTGRIANVTRAFQLPTTMVPKMPLAVQWNVRGYEEVSGGATPPANQELDCKTTNCAHARPVTFTDDSPPATGPSVREWVWNFGDNTPEYRCTTSGADPNGDLCRTVDHTYLGGGDYDVKLTLYDQFGTSGSDTTKIHIDGPIVNLPTMSFDLPSLFAQLTGGIGISPMKITVDGSDSHADGCQPRQMCHGYIGGIKTWHWDFGMAPGTPNAVQEGTGLTSATFIYPQDPTTQTYYITLTAETWDGLTNVSSPVPVTLGPIIPPIGITNHAPGLKAKGDIWFVRNAYFDFQYKNVPVLPGEWVEYEFRITVGSGFGVCGVFSPGHESVTTIVQAGTPGSTQIYRWTFVGNPRGFFGICSANDYRFSARTIRHTPYGTFYGEYSTPELLDPEFF